MAKFVQQIKMSAIFWLGRRLPTCKELAPWMSEAMEQRLSLRKQIILKLHLMICLWCKRYNQQIQSLRSIARSYADDASNFSEETPATLSAEARERLKQALSRQEP